MGHLNLLSPGNNGLGRPARHAYKGLEQLAIRVMTDQTPSGTVHSLYDRAGNLIAETDGTGSGRARRASTSGSPRRRSRPPPARALRSPGRWRWCRT